MIKVILHSEADTQRLANRLAALNPVGSLWLSGDLGAGKTTFTRYLLQAFGHTGAVKSPTYTLVEPYNINGKPIYHADLYRLNDPEELDFIGFFEYFDEACVLVIIEWASQAESILPKADILIDIQKNGEIREMTLQSTNLDFDKLDLIGFDVHYLK